MPQTEARKTLKDAPIMWRRINSIGMILDCNSTYAANLGYAKSEILGKPIFEHVPKESHHFPKSVPTVFQKRSKSVPKYVKAVPKVSERCPKGVPNVSQRCPKDVPKVS